jgi:hypothetical protein
MLVIIYVSWILNCLLSILNMHAETACLHLGPGDEDGLSFNLYDPLRTLIELMIGLSKVSIEITDV